MEVRWMTKTYASLMLKTNFPNFVSPNALIFFPLKMVLNKYSVKY